MRASKARQATGSAVVLALLGAIVGCRNSTTDEELFVSCLNHRAHLRFALILELQPGEKGWPPHFADTPGYEMLARYAGGKQGALNCHHGAPGSRIGGWQAVNLSPERWRELHRLWLARDYPGPLPFFWCGKANALHKRAMCTLWLAEDGWSVDYEVLTETALHDRIDQLNQCLSALDLPPVTADVPDGVAWNRFETGAPR